MNGSKLTFHFRVALLLIIAQAPAPVYAKERHWAGYDRFGPYTVPYGGQVAKMYDELEVFVWTHWHERRTGYASVTSTSLEEGVVCTSTIIIEPDKTGNWTLVDEWKCKSGHRPRAGRRTATSVERLKKDSHGHWSEEEEPLPDSDEAPAGSFVLRLRDASGGRGWLL